MESILEESGSPKTFVPLLFEQRFLKDIGSSYHIYKTPEDYIEIEAQTAAEALMKCEFEKPYKLVRQSFSRLSSLSADMLEDSSAEDIEGEESALSQPENEESQSSVEASEEMVVDNNTEDVEMEMEIEIEPVSLEGEVGEEDIS